MDHEFESFLQKPPGSKKEVCGDFCIADIMDEFNKALFVVCDGLSGHMDSFASKYAAQKLNRRIRRRFFNKDETPVQEMIEAEINKVDTELEAEKAGTTLELALLDQETKILYNEVKRALVIEDELYNIIIICGCTTFLQLPIFLFLQLHLRQHHGRKQVLQTQIKAALKYIGMESMRET